MEELKQQYDEKLAMKEDLRRKAELTEIKLDRAGKLVSGLAGERDRWEKSVQVRWYLDSPKTQNISITKYLMYLMPFQILEENIGYLIGDCLLAAGFLSYAGPFLSNYRDDLVLNTWLAAVSAKKHLC